MIPEKIWGRFFHNLKNATIKFDFIVQDSLEGRIGQEQTLAELKQLCQELSQNIQEVEGFKDETI